MDWSVEVHRIYRYQIKGCASADEAMAIVRRLIRDDVYPSPLTMIRIVPAISAERVIVEPDGSLAVVETDFSTEEPPVSH
jgi:hypothetical protein